MYSLLLQPTLLTSVNSGKWNSYSLVLVILSLFWSFLKGWEHLKSIIFTANNFPQTAESLTILGWRSRRDVKKMNIFWQYFNKPTFFLWFVLYKWQMNNSLQKTVTYLISNVFQNNWTRALDNWHKCRDISGVNKVHNPTN